MGRSMNVAPALSRALDLLVYVVRSPADRGVHAEKPLGFRSNGFSGAAISTTGANLAGRCKRCNHLPGLPGQQGVTSLAGRYLRALQAKASAHRRPRNSSA
jgi:hypothetical protein